MNNSFYLYNANLEKYNLTQATYKVYHALASFADNETRTSYPSVAVIAKRAHVSKSSVSRATRALVAAGLLKIKSRFRGTEERRQSTNLYTLTDHPDTEAAQIIPNKENQLKPADQKLAASPLSGHLIKLYCYLKSHSNKHGQCCTTLRSIAHKFGKSIRTIQRYVKKLLENGLLSIIPQQGDKNTYVIKSLSNRLTEQKSKGEKANHKTSILSANATEVHAFELSLCARIWKSICHILFLQI